MSVVNKIGSRVLNYWTIITTLFYYLIHFFSCMFTPSGQILVIFPGRESDIYSKRLFLLVSDKAKCIVVETNSSQKIAHYNANMHKI